MGMHEIIEEDTFDVQPGGTNLTTSNTFVTSVTLGGGTFTSAAASTRSLTSGKFDTNTGGSSTYADKDLSGTGQSLLFLRWYLRMSDATPVNNFAAITVYSGANTRAQFQPMTAGTFRVRNNVTAVATSTATMADTTFYRFEWKLDYTNTTQTLRYYSGSLLHAEGTNYTEEISGTFNTGTMDGFRFGCVATPGQTLGLNFDNLAYGYTDWIGPTVASHSMFGTQAVVYT